MRQKVVKKIEELVPDTIATGRKGKMTAWKKLNWIEKAKLSTALRNKASKEAEKETEKKEEKKAEN